MAKWDKFDERERDRLEDESRRAHGRKRRELNDRVRDLDRQESDAFWENFRKDMDKTFGRDKR